jgi:transposase
MMIIGVDYHPSFQTIAFFVEETGEYGEEDLNHSDGQAEKFYRDLKQRGISVRVGMEATGYARWFERLLAELGFEPVDRPSCGDQSEASEEAESTTVRTLGSY